MNSKGHEKPVTALAWAVDGGPRLVSASEDGSHRQWDVAAGTETRKLDHGAPITNVVATTDGTKLATVGSDHIVRLWETTGNKLADLQGNPQLDRCNRASQGGPRCCHKSQDNSPRLPLHCDREGHQGTGRVADEGQGDAHRSREDSRRGQGQSPRSGESTSHCQGSSGCQAGRRRAQKGLYRRRSCHQDPRTEAVTKAEEGVASAKRGVDLSEKSIATAKAELETRTKTRDEEIAGEKAATEAVAAAEKQSADAGTTLLQLAFTPDGSALATTDAAGVITLWHVGTQKPLAVIPAETPLTAINAAADGRLLTSTEDGRLLVVRPEPQWTLAGQLGPAADAGEDCVCLGTARTGTRDRLQS